MTRADLVVSLFVVVARLASAQAPPEAPRVWEINGIRLEPAQVERLADDMATRTVAAVEEKIPDIALRDGQAEQMRTVYRGVALEVFAEVVKEVERTDLSDAEKEARVRELVLAGQARSHDALEGILDPTQMARYASWESRQVEAFKSRRWNDRRRRR